MTAHGSPRRAPRPRIAPASELPRRTCCLTWCAGFAPGNAVTWQACCMTGRSRSPAARAPRPPPPHLLLDMVRRLRARERGYLAGLLHDGPVQELAAVPLELAEARRATGTAQRDELGVVAQQVDAASRSLRGLQDEFWPFPRPSSGLAASLKQRTGWLLDTPLAVDAGAGSAGLPEADIQVVADIVELLLAGPAAARASLRSLAAAIGARADLDLHGRRLRVRMEIPRGPHQPALRAAAAPGATISPVDH